MGWFGVVIGPLKVIENSAIRHSANLKLLRNAELKGISFVINSTTSSSDAAVMSHDQLCQKAINDLQKIVNMTEWTALLTSTILWLP